MTAVSLPALLLERADTSPRAVAVRTESSGVWQEAGWADLVATTARTSAVMHDIGVGPGSVVVLVCGSRAEWSVLVVAAQSLGSLVVPLAVDATSEALQAVRATHHVGLWVVESAESYDNLVSSGLEVGSSPVLVVDHRGIDRADALHTWQASVVAADSSDDDDVVGRFRDAVAAIDPDQPAAVFPRDPVGAAGTVAVWTHRQLAGGDGHPVAGLPPGPGLVADDEYLSFLPPVWPVEAFALLREAPMSGATVSFGGRVGGVLADLRSIQPTVVQAPAELWDGIAGEVTARTAESGALARRSVRGLCGGKSGLFVRLARRSIGSKTGLSRVRVARTFGPVTAATTEVLGGLRVALDIVSVPVTADLEAKEPSA